MSITDPPIDTELAGYRIEALLGRGGMGVVYLADDLRLKRKVALKLLAGELSGNEHFRERFLSESELAASIDHPNILPIYDAGEIAGQLYIAMRYVDGTDLKQLLHREGPLDPERALAIVGQLAAALDAAHARGLVHRDVKPSNVLLNLEGHAYLADFGLSRRTTGQTEGTGLVGTIDYVAPEQIRGEPVDGRADLYALGCLLCECLTGEPPFKRDSEAAIIFAHLEEEPPSPPGLEIVVARALAKAPEERYSSGAELVAAAREALGMDGPAPWWRTPVIVSVIGAALALAALLAFLLARGGPGGPTEVKGSLVRIDPATNRVSARIPVGKDPSGVALGVDGVWVADFDDGTLLRIDPTTNTVRQTFSAHGSPTGVAVAGTVVYLAHGFDGAVQEIDAGTGTVNRVVPLGGYPDSPALAATGAGAVWVANGSDRSVVRIDLVTGAEIARIPLPDRADELHSGAHFTGVAADGDAVWIASGELGGTLFRVDTATNRLVATIELGDGPHAIAAGGRAVWVTNQLGDTVSRIDSATNRVVKTIEVGRGPLGIAVGPDGVWVANSLDDTVSRIDPRTNVVVHTTAIGSAPDGIAVRDGSPWVTAHSR
jgi:YVTN family beta-propeller protein